MIGKNWKDQDIPELPEPDNHIVYNSLSFEEKLKNPDYKPFDGSKSSRKGKKNRIKADHTLSDCYKYYTNTVEKNLQLDRKTYMKVVKEFFKKVSEKILLEAEDFLMPCRLGTIRIRKRKMRFANNKLRVDFKKSKDIGKRVYHINDHTNGHIYRWYWNKHKVENGKFYSFTPTRINKRTLAKILKNRKEIDYFF